VYSQARAFLQRPAAEALLRAHLALRRHGYGLRVFDAYRPWYVTRIFRDATPVDKHEFVADPAKGSRHNRGCAVDLTPYDLKTGLEADMPGRVRRDVAALVPDIQRGHSRPEGASRPVAAGDGKRGVPGFRDGVVALRLQGLAAILDWKRGVRAHTVMRWLPSHGVLPPRENQPTG